MKHTLWLALFAALLFAFAGCAEKKGDTGPAGAPGAPGIDYTSTVAEETCSVCHDAGSLADVSATSTSGVHYTTPATTEHDTAITDVSISATDELTVTIRVFTAGTTTPMTTLTSADVRFTVAKLIPASGGNSAYWSDSFTKTETPTAGVGPGGTPALASATQATYQKANTTGGVWDAAGASTGTYVYTFGDGVSATYKFTGMLADTTSTERVAVQVSNGVTNGWVDFISTTIAGSQWTGATAYGPTISFRAATGTPANDIVLTSACNTCHANLALHGGGRRDVEYCVTCHNPGTTDANSGNTLDMKVFIHKIHRGKDLPSVKAGGEYAIWGYMDSKHDYSTGGFPQTLTNCTKCHDAGAGLPNAWTSEPTKEACGSCHDLTSFVDPAPAGYTLHTGGAQADNSSCNSCHNSGKTDLTNIANAHPWAQQVTEAAKYVFVINSATYTAASGQLAVTYSVTYNATAQDLTAASGWTDTTGASRLHLSVGWKDVGKADFTNPGASDGKTPAMPLDFDALAIGGTNPIVDNGNGTYTLTTTLPTAGQAAGTGIVIMDGHPAFTIGGAVKRLPVTNATPVLFAITDTTAVPRRTVVNLTKCQNCHDELSLHGNNRTDNILTCTVCHNTSNTDINRRPADVTQAKDGKAEEGIDFKYMLHRIHAGRNTTTGYIDIFGYGGTEHVFAGEFPPGNPLNNCENCHDAGTYEPPLVTGMQGTTINSGADRVSHADDLRISPNAAVCSGCHDSTAKKTHMEQNGANFSVLESNILSY